MALLVDTNVFIDSENQRLDLHQTLIPWGNAVFIAAVTASELLAGIRFAKTQADMIKRQTNVEAVLSTVPMLDFDSNVARVYAELCADALQNKRRSKVQTHDLQIAATALVHDCTVLTTNLNDFEYIPGLSVTSPYPSRRIHDEPANYTAN